MNLIKRYNVWMARCILGAGVFVLWGCHFPAHAGGRLEFASRSSKLVAGNPFSAGTGTISFGAATVSGGFIRGWAYDSIIKNDASAGGYGTQGTSWLTDGASYTQQTAFSDLVRANSSWVSRNAVAMRATSNWVNANGMQVRTTSNWVNANGMQVRTTSNWVSANGANVRTTSNWVNANGLLVRTTSNAVDFGLGTRTAPYRGNVRAHRGTINKAAAQGKLAGTTAESLPLANEVLIAAEHCLTIGTNLGFNEGALLLHPEAAVVFDDQAFVELVEEDAKAALGGNASCLDLNNGIIHLPDLGIYNLTINEDLLAGINPCEILELAADILKNEKCI